MTKAALRKVYLEKRLSISELQYSHFNSLICKNFFEQMDLTAIEILHSFIPVEKNKEPDTWLIIDQIKKQFPEIRISIPRVNAQTDLLENFFYEGPEQLAKNSWGISEPQRGVRTNTKEIQLVIVPLLVCDQLGNRVGYGKGFYDKFLITCQPSCKRVGISFFEPVEKIDDVAASDVPLHGCITPHHFHKF